MSNFRLAGKFANPEQYAGLGSDFFNVIGSSSKNIGDDKDLINSLTPGDRSTVVLSKLLFGPKESTAEQVKALAPFLKEMEADRVKRATEFARQKLADEALFSGIGALSKGIQTAIAGGSPEMLTYMAQAPLRAYTRFQDSLNIYPRPTLPAFAPSNYTSPRFFG
jgi:hypothetical protein